MTVQFCVQTNGTLLDDEWCDLFLEYGCLVGVSLDGDREGNRYRVYPDGRAPLMMCFAVCAADPAQGAF